MKKYWNRLAAAGMAAMMTGSLLTGCGTQATPENLLRDMTERMEETDSALCTMVMSMEATDGTDTIGLTMDLDMETTSDPDAAHGKGRVDMEVSGTNIGTEMEIYSVEENDQYVTYTMVENQWTRAENEESGMPGNEMFGDIEDQADLFELSEDLVDVNGQECFELQGNIGGDAVGSILEEDMLDSLAGIAVDESELASAEIPCTIDIYRETILPARIYIDMADIMTSVMSGTAAGASFSECYIEMTFTEFDSVDEITVPEEALAATPRVHYVYRSERYSTIVPNAAIYTLDGQAYVRLAVREPSYWSYDYVVRTMPVTVIERGDSHTAISEKLFTSDPVILAPDTMLMDGQRILEQ